jgi:hypothetical protein
VQNPFKPSFGSIPPVLIGRDDILDDFQDGLHGGVGDPYRSMLFTGARGVGKSVMLTELEGIAGEEGLITAKVMTSDSLLEDVFDQTLENSREVLGEKGPHLASVTLPVVGGGVGFVQEEEHGLGWSTGFQRLVRQITDSRSGVFIAVDEVHQSQIAQLRRLFGTYQIMVSSGLNVALAVSGLPNAVSGVLNDEVLTFLQRMTQYVLSDVSLKDVGIALRKTIEEGGRSIATDDLEVATQATLGYPFMIQLVGYHIWRQSPDARAISGEDVAAGIAAAKRRLGAAIHSVSLRDLSEVDRTFLAYMAVGKTPVTMAEMIERMNVSKGYANAYKARLVEAGVVETVARGKIDFSIPYLKDYLADHAIQTYLTKGSAEGSRKPDRPLE